MSTRIPVHVPEAEMAAQRECMRRIAEMPRRPQTYHVVTYGCQMNAHDSEKLAGMLEQMGLTAAPDREQADFVIFNTCCVRDNAERRALGNVTWLKEIRKVRPEMMIAVCGCMIQEPGMAERILKQYPFVDLAFGTANLHRFPSLLEHVLTAGERVVSVEGEDLIAEAVPVRRLRGDAAYLTIMYGCDNFCSYCIVPYVRGRERSRRMADILAEAEALRDSGVREIMLLGQNVNSYCGEGGESFPALLRAVNSLGIERIRFMTSHPKDLSDGLIAAMAECGHVLPQFHLPVQAGNDEILRRMNRRYTRADYLEKVRRLRRTHVKTMPYPGFPTDMQPQVGVCMALARGVSIISEGIYDTRFRYCAELNRMGANIQVDTKVAVIDGVEQLHGCVVKACDLRAGAAMVIAGLAADGVTTVEDVHYIERGYECMIEKLRGLGADITRIESPEPGGVQSAG